MYSPVWDSSPALESMCKCGPNFYVTFFPWIKGLKKNADKLLPESENSPLFMSWANILCLKTPALFL